VLIIELALDVKVLGLYSKINVYQNAQLVIENQMENAFLVLNTVDSALKTDA
jgi:hypothetical protein